MPSFMLLCACLISAQADLAPIEAIYAKRYSENPNDARSAYILGLANWSRGDAQAARAMFAQMSRFAPDAMAGLHAEAMALEAAGANAEDKAATLARLRLVALQKNAPWDVWFDLGNLLLRANDAKAAAEAFAHAAHLAPHCAVVYHNAGVAYLYMGDLELAGEAFVRADVLAPDFAPTRYAQGVLAALERRDGEALGAMQSGPGDAASWAYNRGSVAMRTGDIGAAARAYEQAAMAAPQWAQVYTNLGVVQDWLSDDVAANKSFLWAAALAKQGNTGAYNLGLAYFRTGDLVAARGALEAAVRQNAHDADAWLHLGQLYFQLGAPGRAYAALEAAAIETRRSARHSASEHVAPALGQAAAAPMHAPLADNVQVDPKLSLARSYLENGHAAEAIALLEPRSKNSVKNPAWDTVLGWAYRAQGRMDRAAHWFERAAHDGPPVAVAFFNWGVALLDAERPADARRALLQAVRLDAGMAEAYYFLAVIAQRTGRRGEALSQARVARRLDVHHEEARRLIEALTFAP